MADYSWPNVSMLEGCGELPLHPPSVAGTFYFGSRMSALGHSRRFDRVRPTFAVGTRVTSRPPHRSVRAQFGHTACMGLSLSRWRHANLVVLCIPFFCSTRAASIPPSRPHISIAVAAQRPSRTALLQRRRRLVLDGREHDGRLLAIGWLAAQ